MYRRRRHFSTNLVLLILMGGIAGITFLVYDAIQSHRETPAMSEPIQQAQPADSTAVSPQPTSPPLTAVPVLHESYASIEGASLFIPSAGILAPIIQVYLDGTSWDVSELGGNVGHLQGTTWMQEGIGNIVLSAHVELRDGRAGPFAKLGELQVQDRIVLRQGDEERIYRVIDVRNVQPDDLSPLYPSTTELLTLITCDLRSFDFLSNTYKERTVVIAERLS